MNIVVTSTTNSVRVDFGGYASTLGILKGTWNKQRIRFNLRSDNIEVLVQGENSFGVVWQASNGYLVIDTVDGVAPTSNSDLYDKLIALIA